MGIDNGIPPPQAPAAPPAAPKESKYSHPQFWVGVLVLLLGIGLFVADATDRAVFDAEFDFGWLPLALIAVAIYVVFDLYLPDFMGRDKQEAKS